MAAKVKQDEASRKRIIGQFENSAESAEAVGGEREESCWSEFDPHNVHSLKSLKLKPHIPLAL